MQRDEGGLWLEAGHNCWRDPEAREGHVLYKPVRRQMVIIFIFKNIPTVYTDGQNERACRVYPNVQKSPSCAVANEYAIENTRLCSWKLSVVHCTLIRYWFVCLCSWTNSLEFSLERGMQISPILFYCCNYCSVLTSGGSMVHGARGQRPTLAPLHQSWCPPCNLVQIFKKQTKKSSLCRIPPPERLTPKMLTIFFFSLFIYLKK